MRTTLIAHMEEELAPPVTQYLLVGPPATFADLAETIERAFGRTEPFHHHYEFGLPWRLIRDARAGEKYFFPLGPRDKLGMLNATKARLDWELAGEDTVVYVSDLRDPWLHELEIVERSVDPVAVYGKRPTRPVVLSGWEPGPSEAEG